MPLSIRFCLIVLLLVNCAVVAQQPEDDILLADPMIFEEEGVFYLYGTKEDATIPGAGFLVYTSTDLEHWSGPAGATDGYAFKKGAGFGTKGFWAPQVFKHKERYYMAYTANEQIAIATADSPLGPFTNSGTALAALVKQIDPFVFFDGGKVYLYHVRLQEGNRIFVAELTEDLSAIKTETLNECLHATTGWENTQNTDWPVSEGPTVFKKGKTYYLMYSANDFRNPDYAVGYATATHPLGPWTKYKGNPIISENTTQQPGIGHGDLFTDQNGMLRYVLHTHNSKNQVGPRKTGSVQLRLKDGTLELVPDSFKQIKL
ncbi:glycoside hydrolase family 43 protein [Leeuwenhoekiella sp. ZYFB001]|uniref:glycoside hydrolase family 43 protein n=1 Tax=Leeuwenhoekiella sp. ZYFB001 TaxID=2719912 RepID=UPI0039779C19